MKTTRYFEEQVLPKRPYIDPNQVSLRKCPVVTGLDEVFTTPVAPATGPASHRSPTDFRSLANRKHTAHCNTLDRRRPGQ